jgi:hypothetical protein
MLRVKREERVKEDGKLENDTPEYANHRRGSIIKRRTLYRIAINGLSRPKDRASEVNSQTHS